MTCHRRYTFVFHQNFGHAAVLQGLEEACERRWWFNEPGVTGAALGLLTATFTVSARDQWFAHKRAMGLMEAAAWPTPVPTPTWETLPPHANRGYNRVRS